MIQRKKTFQNVFKTPDKLNFGAFIYRDSLVSPVTSSVVEISLLSLSSMINFLLLWCV